MKTLLLALPLFISCGTDKELCALKGEHCHVTDPESLPDEAPTVQSPVVPKDGRDGKNGVDGKDGVAGKDGKNGVDGTDGKDGNNGADGVNGKDGAPGQQGAPGKDKADTFLSLPASDCHSSVTINVGNVLYFEAASQKTKIYFEDKTLVICLTYEEVRSRIEDAIETLP